LKESFSERFKLSGNRAKLYRSSPTSQKETNKAAAIGVCAMSGRAGFAAARTRIVDIQNALLGEPQALTRNVSRSVAG
jgi:hypothetical protein